LISTSQFDTPLPGLDVVNHLIEFPPVVDASDPIWQINARTLFDVGQEILRGPRRASVILARL